jgi:hypothetical protein
VGLVEWVEGLDIPDKNKIRKCDIGTALAL